MKTTIRELIQIIILVAMLQFGFHSAYAFIWYLTGLPVTVWITAVIILVAGATNYLFIRWIGGTNGK